MRFQWVWAVWTVKLAGLAVGTCAAKAGGSCITVQIQRYRGTTVLIYEGARAT